MVIKMTAQNIFDDPIFFDGYKKIRDNPDNLNIHLEKPALFAMLPDLHGKSVLDLGCGFGENCTEFLNRGACGVIGVDISKKMLEVAKSQTSGIEFICADMNELSGIAGKYDVVCSSLAVHYVADFNKFCCEVRDLLNTGGYFIFSQESPLNTARCNSNDLPRWTRDENDKKLFYNLKDYDRVGYVEEKWIVDKVIKYHRRYCDIVNALSKAGFIIEMMDEPVGGGKANNDGEGAHFPYFLLVKARKI
ncbi:MAG: class I SAM-dependent methyltransferase [Oscillospiraceae bacterium]|jgi:SAM-dependent methyltransferase|nr:class I SAM-dependent methyltransferase [Oscillospiraceae bacterium]